MEYENIDIKQNLLILFEEGKTENEAFEELSKTHRPNSISLKAISSWFTKFRSGENSVSGKRKPGRPAKFTDEFLIKLVNENPELNMTELAKLANTSQTNIAARLKKINTSGKGVNYVKKCAGNGSIEFTDEFLIDLVNKYPGLNITELGRLTYTSPYTISKRLKQINSSEQRVNYTDKSFKSGAKRFTDEYLINLIKKHPGLNMSEIAELANTCASNISIRLKKINSNRPINDKIIVLKHSYRTERKSYKNICNDALIKLVDENPELNTCELANLTGVSEQAMYLKLNDLDVEGCGTNYVKKSKKNGATKFTDEFLINLVNEYPEYNMGELGELTNTTHGTISNRLKQINSDGNNAGYVKKGTHNGPTKFTDEFLIDLINENPGLNMADLAKLAGASIQTISNALKRINKDGESLNIAKKAGKKFTDEFLINLVNENPTLNITQLAKLANTTPKTLSMYLKQINADGEKLTVSKNRGKKFSDEYLIELINDNPTLTMVELAKITNVSPRTISNRLKQINSDSEKVKYTYKNTIDTKSALLC